MISFILTAVININTDSGVRVLSKHLGNCIAQLYTRFAGTSSWYRGVIEVTEQEL